MSSFISFRPEGQSIRIGNPSFGLLLRHLKDNKESIPSVARIVEMNPIADSIGLLNLGGFAAEDIKVFLAFTEGVLQQTESSPLTEAGFNMYQDLARFVEELKTHVSITEWRCANW